MIIYLIGQPEAGKTTLANALKEYYPSRTVIHIDGDALRKASSNLNYDEDGRRYNIRQAHHYALAVMNLAKVDRQFKPLVIISMVSPYRDLREELKEVATVAEVYLFSGREGRIKYHVQNFELPGPTSLRLDTDKPIHVCLGEIVSYVEEVHLNNIDDSSAKIQYQISVQ
jgi:GTPase SAR1 family protein